MTEIGNANLPLIYLFTIPTLLSDRESSGSLTWLLLYNTIDIRYDADNSDPSFFQTLVKMIVRIIRFLKCSDLR